MKCVFSQETLENLLIAIVQLKNSEGLLIAIHPSDVLQDWVLEQLPEPIINGFNPMKLLK